MQTSQGDLNPQYHHHIQDSRFIMFAPTSNLHKILQNCPKVHHQGKNQHDN